MRFNLAALVTVALAIGVCPSISAAQPPTTRSRPQGSSSRTAVWTAVGIGGGFGIGLVAGLSAFDDAIDSDRKVWTTAIVGAAAGGTLAYLFSRSRRSAPPSPLLSAAPRRQHQAPLDEREIRALAAGVSLRR